MVCLWVFGNEAFARIQRSFHTFFLEGSKEGRAQFLLAEPAPPRAPRLVRVPAEAHVERGDRRVAGDGAARRGHRAGAANHRRPPQSPPKPCLMDPILPRRGGVQPSPSCRQP